jgi:transcriptional regulator with GAF, ATPase, and Fis domain
MEMASIDAVARALFRLVWRDLKGDDRPRLRTLDPSGAVESPTRRTVVPGLIGESASLREALNYLPALAEGEMPILVLGESGTGKELVARQVHDLSLRAGGAFVAFNCAAVAEHLLMSDLFGHVRGAFTGAERDRMGLFESARGGTVFLDEIGDLPPEAQGMFLRVLQEREVRRVGETLPRKVDVRVVAATHRGLEEMVEEGTFRRDLYFRLRVAEVRLPPLRSRGRDVLLLTRHFLRRLQHEGGIDAEAERDLLAHNWPGNVRELGNVLDVAVALSGGGTIERRHLQIPESTVGQTGDVSKQGSGYHQSVLDYRRGLVVEALQGSDGNQAQAARRLGLTRQALSYLVKSLEITSA